MHPSTVALTDDEMFGYFAAVISSVGIPVLLHHAKSFAKNPLSIDVQVRLLEEFGPVRVQFKPEASPTPPRVSELRDRTGGQARIFEGDGGMMLLDCHRRGLAGTIPATETAEIVRTMWDLLEAGERAKAEPLAHGLSYLMCHMMNSIDFYLAIAKQFLVERGLMSNARIRGPVRFRLDEETRAEVTHTYTSLLALAKELS
jgi:4-hydroxy-tetrahydrodipicolinate synthase